MRQPTGNLAAVILAAGEGRRVGGPKLGLTLGDETFLSRIVRLAREAGVARIIAVLPPGLADPGLEGVSAVRNPNVAGGPSSSLRAGLDAAGDVDAVLCWPVDHPSVRAATVRSVIERWRTGSAGAVVPTFAGRGGHPTLFGRRLFGALRFLEGEGAREVLRRNAGLVLRFEVDDEGVIADVDAPEDLDRARSSLR